MGIHRQTVYQRLGRIQEQTAPHLASTFDEVSLWLGLQARSLGVAWLAAGGG